MIYFNNKKEAFAFEIENPVLILDDSVWAEFCNDPTSWDIIDNKFIDLRENDEYKTEQAQKRQEQFETEFFNTSLGYIRRKVTMANGDIKDFLTDLLPSIAMGIQLNQPVSIIAYKKPDFTEEITDLVKYQEVKKATAEFVQECFMQLNNDFMPPKVEEDLNSGEIGNTEDEPMEGDTALIEPEESEVKDEE